VPRNQGFIPVLLFISGRGTITVGNDRAAEEQTTLALASQKHAVVLNAATPSETVNLFVAETSISSAYQESLRRAL
jgi:hypothetical protein